MPEEQAPERRNARYKGMEKIPGMAMLLMLMGILAPSVGYSIRLSDPTPTQLITAISISLFASVLFLWLLDATAVFRFRSTWVSRSVYGIGVAAIISATVGIYKDAFTEHLHPFDGPWHLSAWAGNGQRIADGHDVLLYYNKAADAYTGYSSFVPSNAEEQIRHVRVELFDPKAKTLTLTILRGALEGLQLDDGIVKANYTSFEFSSGTASTVGAVRYVFTRP